MNIVGIICEYNPFHNGHIYHINKCKELYPDSLIILAINGLFTERGLVSSLTKEDKTKLALSYGVDLVIELPIYFGTQSGDFFAYAALKLLNALGVNKLVFGSENTDLERLTAIAKKELNNDYILDNTSKDSYPKRLAESLGIEKVLPNDLLGISYIKNILKYNYPITPVLIKRTSSYHDTNSTEKIISASNILEKKRLNKPLEKYLPAPSLESILEVNDTLLFQLLYYKILTSDNLNEYKGVTEGLDHKLKKVIKCSHSYNELIENLKSKRYTYNRLRRMLIHLLLEVKKGQVELTYIHILGFNKNGSSFLRENKDNFLLPTKVDYNSTIYKTELLASLIYDMLTNANTYAFEIRNKPIYKQD